MAILKQRLHRKNENGTYDTVHLETSANLVMMGNGATVEAVIQDKADISHVHTEYAASSHTHTKSQITDFPASIPTAAHTHAAGDITSGTLPITRGGTGGTSAAASHYMLTNPLNTLTQTDIADTDYIPILDTSASTMKKVSVSILRETIRGTVITPAPKIGDYITWCGLHWVVVHIDSAGVYCACTEVVFTSQFNSSSSNYDYNNSTIANTYKARESNYSSHSDMYKAQWTIIPNTNIVARFFAPSREELLGGFSYFNSDERRIFKQTGRAVKWWTRSSSGSGVYVANESGAVVSNTPIDTLVCRIFVILAL